MRKENNNFFVQTIKETIRKIDLLVRCCHSVFQQYFICKNDTEHIVLISITCVLTPCKQLTTHG